MGGLSGISIAIIAAALIFLLFVILKFPVKLLFRLIINTIVGFAALFLINIAGGLIGVSVAVNWLNAAIVGVLGLPGVALILLLQWLAAFA